MSASVPAWLLQPPWLPVVAPLQGTEQERSASLLHDVAAQFEVTVAPRYAPTSDGRTWCKTYLWDVLTALGCGEVAAHWVDRNGVPTPPGKGMETRANDVVMRLGRGLYGWRSVDAAEAYLEADRGRPAVVGWFNRNGGPGHVALVLPGKRIAQAGRTNLFGAPVSAGFGALPVSFFVHS